MIAKSSTGFILNCSISAVSRPPSQLPLHGDAADLEIAVAHDVDFTCAEEFHCVGGRANYSARFCPKRSVRQLNRSGFYFLNSKFLYEMQS